MKNILFVSIAFPPKSDPECIQVGRYYNSIVKDPNLHIDVVTSSKVLFMPIDKELQDSFNVKGKLFDIPISESKWMNFLRKKINKNFFFKPDPKYSFYKNHENILKSLDKEIHLIYSRSFPLSSAFLARKLSEELQVPWIMHLSDPWSLSPLHNYDKSEFDYHKNEEMKSFQFASIISFTNEKTKDLYAKEYPEYVDKFVVFPNVYDSTTNLKMIEYSKSDIKRIVYTGGLANTRSISSFLEALKKLEKRVDSLEKVEIILAGDMDRKNRGLISEFQRPYLKHIGSISGQKSLELQNSANLLLAIDSQIRVAEKNVFLPSKLLDYAMIQKPILALTHPKSVTADFLKEVGGVSFDHHEINKISSWLEKFILNQIEIKPKKLSKYYSSEYQGRELAKLMLSLTN